MWGEHCQNSWSVAAKRLLKWRFKIVELEHVVGYNPCMANDPISTIPQIDIVALCKVIEKITRFTQKQMAQKLGVNLNTYERWRYTDREPQGNAVARLFVLREEIEKEYKVSIPIPYKENKQ